MITGNKGEWSEIYALFKLLGDGRVYAGDADMNKLAVFYPILHVLREDCKKYDYEVDTNRKLIVCHEDGSILCEMSMQTFVDNAEDLYKTIKGIKKQSSFCAPTAESFMNTIGCKRLKAPSTDKADIHIVIHDLRTNMTPLLGFSIKSQLGNPSTLLNAGKTTNFIYKVCGNIDDTLAKRINQIADHLPRFEEIYNCGLSLSYYGMENQTFQDNLIFICDSLPQIVAECLLEDSKPNSDSNIKTAVENVAKRNPLSYTKGKAEQIYKHRIKQLLIDAALGMTPATEWVGKYDANGGYIVVKKDGDIVCYHFYNRNDIEDYLFNNTRFERASRSRYGFGEIYKEGEDFFIKLNLQIRFKM